MISITDRAWRMMMLAAKHNKGLEVSWFMRGHVDYDEGIIVFTDIFIPPQEVGGAHTEITGEQIEDWLLPTLLATDIKPKEVFGWGHSHVNMSTNPSPTDHDTLFYMAQYLPAQFAVGLVVNLRGEHTGWLAYKSPVLPGFVEQTLTVGVQEPKDPELEAQVSAMMEHVVEPKRMISLPSRQQGSTRQFFPTTKFPDEADPDAEADAWYQQLRADNEYYARLLESVDFDD